MPNIFTTVPIGVAKRNKFSMRNTVSGTVDFGTIYPIYCEEVLPNDTWRGSTNTFVEFMPMVFPVRAEVDVFVHHFFVPFRLIWQDWEEFMTGEPATKVTAGETYTPPVEPSFYLNHLHCFNEGLNGSLADWLGFPTLATKLASHVEANDYPVSILPFKAYQKIYNDWYLDKNLSDAIDISLTSGNHAITGTNLNKYFKLRSRNWRKDYFTSALPYAQRGGAVEIQSAEMLVELQSGLGPDSIQFVTSDGTVVKSTDIVTDSNGAVTDGQGHNIYFDPVGSLGVKGSLFTVEDLRNYLAVQRQFELDALGGSRYIDWVLANFKVQGDDLRLQRCQYLGGSKSPVMVSTVRQTSSSTEGENGLGEPAGVAVQSGGGNGFTMHFKEHGLIMSCLTVLPRSQYFQGIPRKFMHRVREDYFLPMFQHLGEQAIKSAELYYDSSADQATNDVDFGYAPRYAEYKWTPSTIHGEFKTSLFDYTMARNFASRPALNSNFIAMTPDQVSHVFANISSSSFSDNHLILTAYNDFTKLSVMKRNPRPKII